MKKAMKRAIGMILALSLTAVLLIGCSSGTPAASVSVSGSQAAAGSETPSVSAQASVSEDTGAGAGYKVKFAPFVSYTGVGTFFGIEKGIFKDAGLDLEIINLDDKISGLVSGDIDFADLNTSQAIAAIAQGAPFKIVGSMFRTKGAFYLIGSPEIKEISDLKGKNVGIAMTGSGLDAYTRVILKENGVDPDKDVTLIANGVYQNALASLESGQVDATIIHQPFVQLAEEQGIGQLLAKGYDYLPTFHTGVLVASDSFIQNNPEELKKIIKAYYDSWTYAKDNEEELLDFGADYIQIDRETLKKALESELALWELKPEVDVSAINDTQDVQIELGFQDEKYDVTGFIDESFLPGQ
jgi:ABC-type nitrate/sulfonate/bicarbonate transport system substrate-binding protein